MVDNSNVGTAMFTTLSRGDLDCSQMLLNILVLGKFELFKMYIFIYSIFMMLQIREIMGGKEKF